LLASGIPFSRNAVLGLILQSAIPHGTDLRNEWTWSCLGTTILFPASTE
jgi:hypothetical protein